MAPRMAPVVVLVVALVVGAMAPGSPVSPRTPKLDGAPDDVSPEKDRGAPRGPRVIGEEGQGGRGGLLGSSRKIDGGEEKEGVGGEGEERVESKLEEEERMAEERLIEGIDRYNARFSSPPRCVVRLPRGARELPPRFQTPRRSRSAPRRLNPRRFSCPATPGRIPRPLPPRREETEKERGGGGEGTRKGEGGGTSPLRGGAPYAGRARTARHSAASASSSSSSSSASYSSSSPADASLGRG